MNFTLSPSYGKPRRFETARERRAPASTGIWISVTAGVACWVAIGTAIWDLCK